MKNFIRVAVVVALLALLLLWRPFSPRWVLELIPAHEDLEVRVRLTNEATERFKATIRGNWSATEHRTIIVLKSGNTYIPGGEILFSDTTFFPGAFKIRLNGKMVLIQENGVTLLDAEPVNK